MISCLGVTMTGRQVMKTRLTLPCCCLGALVAGKGANHCYERCCFQNALILQSLTLKLRWSMNNHLKYRLTLLLAYWSLLWRVAVDQFYTLFNIWHRTHWAIASSLTQFPLLSDLMLILRKQHPLLIDGSHQVNAGMEMSQCYNNSLDIVKNSNLRF